MGVVIVQPVGDLQTPDQSKLRVRIFASWECKVYCFTIQNMGAFSWGRVLFLYRNNLCEIGLGVFIVYEGFLGVGNISTSKHEENIG